MRIPILTALPWFVPGFGVSVVLGYITRHRAARWLGVSPLIAWALVVSLGMIVSATLTPVHEVAPSTGPHLPGCDLSRIGRASLSDVLRLGETSLNILLFIPLGAMTAIGPGGRRKFLLTAGAVLLPFVIEGIQLLATPLGRSCQSADVVDNLTGLLIGLALGSIVATVRLAARNVDSGRRRD